MVPQGIKPVLQRTAIEVSGGEHTGGETQKREPSRPGGHRAQPAPFFLPPPRSTWRIWLSLVAGQPLGLPPFAEKLGADPEN